MIIARRKLSSAIGPRMKPRTIGAAGKSLRRMKYPRMPNRNIRWTSNIRPLTANDPTQHSAKTTGIRIVREIWSTLTSGRTSARPRTVIAIVESRKIAVTVAMKSGCSIGSSGPGRMPWSHMAASSTAAGALPGTASVSTGMIAPPTHALLAVSAAMSPSCEPRPNSSG